MIKAHELYIPPIPVQDKKNIKEIIYDSFEKVLLIKTRDKYTFEYRGGEAVEKFKKLR